MSTWYLEKGLYVIPAEVDISTAADVGSIRSGFFCHLSLWQIIICLFVCLFVCFLVSLVDRLFVCFLVFWFILCLFVILFVYFIVWLIVCFLVCLFCDDDEVPKQSVPPWHISRSCSTPWPKLQAQYPTDIPYHSISTISFHILPPYHTIVWDNTR